MCRSIAACNATPSTITAERPTLVEDTKPSDANNKDLEAGVILATRYKTKMCLSIEQGEECPYQNRCMFAHSEEELRTKEQNLAEGITTEAAIRDHRRRVHMQIKQRNKRKEKRREKQVKKQQLRDMEAQGITLPEYHSHQPAHGGGQEGEEARSASYRHDPYAPWRPSHVVPFDNKLQMSCGETDEISEDHSAGGETDSSQGHSGAPSPCRRASSSCVISFDSCDFFSIHDDIIPSASSSSCCWSHNPYPKVIFHSAEW